VPYETFSISCHFHQIVYENTLYTMFHLSIKGYRKTRPHRSYCFCKCSSFIVNGITEMKSHIIAGVRNDVNTPRKLRRRDADTRTAATTRRSVTIGGVSKMSAAAARRCTALVPAAFQQWQQRSYPLPLEMTCDAWTTICAIHMQNHIRNLTYS